MSRQYWKSKMISLCMGIDYWTKIVNGTLPTCINNNIVTMITLFSPTTEIRELPSIWTIWRARTVLLFVVQTLATYRIAKANKWEQLFTDGTSRRQVAFQSLIVSIEEDDLFKWVLETFTFLRYFTCLRVVLFQTLINVQLHFSLGWKIWIKLQIYSGDSKGESVSTRSVDCCSWVYVWH